MAAAKEVAEIRLATANRRVYSEIAGCSADSVEPEPTKMSSQVPFSEDWSAITKRTKETRRLSLCLLHCKTVEACIRLAHMKIRLRNQKILHTPSPCRLTGKTSNKKLVQELLHINLGLEYSGIGISDNFVTFTISECFAITNYVYTCMHARCYILLILPAEDPSFWKFLVRIHSLTA